MEHLQALRIRSKLTVVGLLNGTGRGADAEKWWCSVFSALSDDTRRNGRACTNSLWTERAFARKSALDCFNGDTTSESGGSCATTSPLRGTTNCELASCRTGVRSLADDSRWVPLLDSAVGNATTGDETVSGGTAAPTVSVDKGADLDEGVPPLPLTRSGDHWTLDKDGVMTGAPSRSVSRTAE
jgi:hypothetical protein